MANRAVAISKSVECLRSRAGRLTVVSAALSGYAVVAVVLTLVSTASGNGMGQLWWLMSGIIAGAFAAAAAVGAWVLAALADAGYAEAVAEAFEKK